MQGTMHTKPAAFQRLRSGTGFEVGSLLQVFASLLWLPQAGLLAYALQRLADGGGLPAVYLPASLIFILGVLRAVCDAAGVRRVFKSARTELSRLREQVAASLAARSPLDVTRPASGLAASVMAEQAEAIVPYLTRYRPARLRTTFVPLAILIVVAPLSWVAALILLVAAPLIPVFMALVGWRAKAASEAQMVEMGGMNAFLLDRLRGLATLRTLGAVEATAQRLHESAQSLRQRTMAVLRIAFLSSAVLELFAALGVAMMAVYIGFHLLGQIEFGAWGTRLTLGQGLFILLLSPAFFEPLRELSAVWHDKAAGDAALAALDRLSSGGLLLPDANQDQDRMAEAPLPGAPAVLIEQLSFAYPGSKANVFEHFDLHIAPGEHVAIMAASGGGKSSLLSLLAGLLPLPQGIVTIGGIRLSAHSVQTLRQRMAWIGQKPHIFAGSVHANVAMRRAGVGAAEVAAALSFAELDRVAQARPSVALAEGGGGLSGGEAVRLALARAAADPHADLLLVDEPTAHLDQLTAQQVTQALLQLAQGKTMIIATHDPVLAARMDRVIVLPSGGQA
ncbi:ABC-type transport system involved in cytochrome bd biosynthesis, ATPase and permease components [Janthinobacterium sp. Marseille]|nr:ABC-type transport system involved in cytochrome bd biosynthesis, ATPase and permease components [Janthinobacterium sp. Marseille]